MAHFGISIRSAADTTAVIKVLRRYASTPVSLLRKKIGTNEIALEIAERDYPIELGLIEGTSRQQQLFLRVCSELREAGAAIDVWHWTVDESQREAVSDEVLRNLMAAHREDLERQFD